MELATAVAPQPGTPGPFVDYREERVGEPESGGKRRAVRYYAIAAGGGEALVATGAETAQGDGHYLYASTPEGFCAFGKPLTCHNRVELYAWLDAGLAASQRAAAGGAGERGDDEAAELYVAHAAEDFELPDGRRGVRFFLIDRDGRRVLAVLGEERQPRDGHYNYRREPSFSGGPELVANNRQGVREWLREMMGPAHVAHAMVPTPAVETLETNARLATEPPLATATPERAPCEARDDDSALPLPLPDTAPERNKAPPSTAPVALLRSVPSAILIGPDVAGSSGAIFFPEPDGQFVPGSSASGFGPARSGSSAHLVGAAAESAAAAAAAAVNERLKRAAASAVRREAHAALRAEPAPRDLGVARVATERLESPAVCDFVEGRASDLHTINEAIAALRTLMSTHVSLPLLEKTGAAHAVRRIAQSETNEFVARLARGVLASWCGAVDQLVGSLSALPRQPSAETEPPFAPPVVAPRQAPPPNSRRNSTVSATSGEAARRKRSSGRRKSKAEQEATAAAMAAAAESGDVTSPGEVLAGHGALAGEATVTPAKRRRNRSAYGGMAPGKGRKYCPNPACLKVVGSPTRTCPYCKSPCTTTGAKGKKGSAPTPAAIATAAAAAAARQAAAMAALAGPSSSKGARIAVRAQDGGACGGALPVALAAPCPDAAGTFAAPLATAGDGGKPRSRKRAAGAAGASAARPAKRVASSA